MRTDAQGVNLPASTQEKHMPQQDATVLLDEDHNQAMRLFEQYKAAHDGRRQQVIASELCQALLVHMQIEEEIFYPAFQRATGDQELLKDSQREHQEARDLIAKIQADRQNGKLMLELEDAILHHVNDEREKMFPKARAAQGMNLMQLGEQLEMRKNELMEAHPA
jgi:iron-sulfur cluster repair protein YtfE (RIC family)